MGLKREGKRRKKGKEGGRIQKGIERNKPAQRQVLGCSPDLPPSADERIESHSIPGPRELFALAPSDEPWLGCLDRDTPKKGGEHERESMQSGLWVEDEGGL